MSSEIFSFKRTVLGKNKGTTGLLLFIFFYSVFSGGLRKWIIDNGTVNAVITFVQIGIPWLLLWSLLKKSIKDKQSISILLLYLFILNFFAVNPLNSTFVHGLAGIIIHGSFLILFVFYFNFKESVNFHILLSCILLIGLLETFIGAVQYVSSPDSWINVYAGFGGDEAIESSALVGGAVRVTGTFSYLSGYTSFLLCYLFFSCYMLRVHSTNIWTYVVVFSGLYCALISGARSAVGMYLLTLLIFIPLETNMLKRPEKLIAIIGTALVILILNISLSDPLGILNRFQAGIDNFVQRVEGNQEEGAARLYSDFLDLFTKEFDYRLTGVGLGSTYQGVNQLMGGNPLLDNIYYEGELFRLMLEGGILLVLAKFLIIGYILSKMHFSRLFKLFLFVLLGVYTPLVFNAYNAIFAAIGLMILDQAYQKQDYYSA